MLLVDEQRALQRLLHAAVAHCKLEDSNTVAKVAAHAPCNKTQETHTMQTVLHAQRIYAELKR
jgi:hypothetical protein